MGGRVYRLAMHATLEDYWFLQKEIAIAPVWKDRPHEEFSRLVCPLDIDGVTVRGLKLTLSAHRITPDRWLTVQLEYESVQRPRGAPFARFEWRPRAPHNNKGLGPDEYRFMLQRDSHLHCFEMNWAYSEKAVEKGNLPISVPVEAPLDTYDDALAFVEQRFRIAGVRNLPPPPWSAKMSL